MQFFVFNLKNTYDYDGCREWFEKALALPFHKQMVWGISDIKTMNSLAN